MVAERDLVGLVILGDPRAEEAFFRAYQPRLLRAAVYFLGGRDSEAEDIVQDTFMVAMPKLKDYVFKAPLYAWLREICLRLCYARLRLRRRVLVSLEGDLELFMRRLAVERMDREEQDARQGRRLALLEGLKARLAPDSLAVLELRDAQGMRYAQIAARLGIPMGTVMSRLARARSQLRKLALATPEPGTLLLARPAFLKPTAGAVE